MRAVVLTIEPRPFIDASRAIGMSNLRILFRHIIPNAMPPVIVVATVSAATAILAEAGLSYLGLGVQPPTPTWGNIIADGQSRIVDHPRSEEHTSELQSLMRISYAVFGLKKK